MAETGYGEALNQGPLSISPPISTQPQTLHALHGSHSGLCDVLPRHNLPTMSLHRQWIRWLAYQRESLCTTGATISARRQLR